MQRKFDDAFRALTGWAPHPYQRRVAERLGAGRDLVLRAPTGAGKTLAVLVPFFHERTRGGATRLIYALPLRTLAQGIFREARDLAARWGGRLRVTLQTGEQPDDPFFSQGDVVVTTYDQVLSGLLDGPYGLSNRLHNVNAAAVAGALVVFDEFHLMEPHLAFLTAAALLHLHRGTCQSVWMTATATSPLVQVLADALGAEPVGLEAEELRALPSVAEVERRVVIEGTPLDADALVRGGLEGRVIAIANTVARAQALYQGFRARAPSVTAMLLHSRFFAPDRRSKEARLREWLGRGAERPAVLVATQVVEAGLDLSCERLHTEVAPVNALVQRAGRCARFPGERGTVHVHPLPEAPWTHLPYARDEVDRAFAILSRSAPCAADPIATAEWVQEAHASSDAEALREGWQARLRECLRLIHANAVARAPARVAQLIRGNDSESVRVIVADAPPHSPGRRHAVSVPRRSLREVASVADSGWVWDPSIDPPWRGFVGFEQLRATYAVCLRPHAAAYDEELGLRIGAAGDTESPPRDPSPRPGHPLRRESWVDHALAVRRHAERRFERDFPDGSRLSGGYAARYGLVQDAVKRLALAAAMLHDLGKLSRGWQQWAEAAQRARDPGHVQTAPLAHTDFDPENPDDRVRERALPVRRPWHAAQGGYLAGALLGQLVTGLPDPESAAAAACAAIVAHHGGWVPDRIELDALCEGWTAALRALPGVEVNPRDFQRLLERPDREGTLRWLLDSVCADAERLGTTWPLVAYLVRTVRLSDQGATAEHTHG